jgi:hypothetical protein
MDPNITALSLKAVLSALERLGVNLQPSREVGAATDRLADITRWPFRPCSSP